MIEEKGKDIRISGYLDEKLSVIRISVKGEYFQTLLEIAQSTFILSKNKITTCDSANAIGGTIDF